MKDARSPDGKRSPRCRSTQQRRATSLQIDPVIPGGWSGAHLESHLVEPMPIVIPPGWSGAPARDDSATHDPFRDSFSRIAVNHPLS